MEQAAERPEKVATQHEAGGRAIEALRRVAATIKEIGDQHVELTEGNESLREQLHGMEEDAAQQRDARATLSEWSELLSDFGRGLVDQQELLTKTVGRP